MIEKSTFNQLFAERLRISLLEAGYHSQRSTSGVDIHKLAQITEYSPQICRKYLRGQAIPEPAKLIQIAAKLNVSPGWLLFGDTDRENCTATDTIIINGKLLYYIFAKSLSLYDPQNTPAGFADLLLKISKEVGQLGVSLEQAKMVIDLALSTLPFTAAETRHGNDLFAQTPT